MDLKSCKLPGSLLLGLLLLSGCGSEIERATQIVDSFRCSPQDFAVIYREMNQMVEKANASYETLTGQLTQTGRPQVYDLIETLNLKMSQECSAELLQSCGVAQQKVGYHSFRRAKDKNNYLMLQGPIFSFGIRTVIHKTYSPKRTSILVDYMNIDYPQAFHAKMKCFSKERARM